MPRLVELFGPEEAVALAQESTCVYDAVRALGEDVWLTDDEACVVLAVRTLGFSSE